MNRIRSRIKQWQKWVAAILLFVLGLAVWTLWPAEPEYRGKSLTVWLGQINEIGARQRRPKEIEAIEAVRQIGTNGLPRLLQLLRVRDSSIKLAIKRLLIRQRWIHFQMHDAADWHRRAHRGLWVLGSNAAPAIPLLEQHLLAEIDRKRFRFDQNERQSVAVVLAEIGPPAFSIFEKALTNRNYEIRRAAIAWLWYSTNHLSSMASLLARSVQSEPETGMRTWAAILLAKTGQYEELAVPVLLSGMKYRENDTRADSARAMLHYPAHARKHIEEIRALGNDPDIIARNGARDALLMLDPEAAERIK